MIETVVKKSKRSPDSKDKVIGSRIKAYRDITGLSQSELGDAVGVTFQQIQKYEHGTNKLSVVRLLEICAALKVSVNSFLKGLDTVLPMNSNGFLSASDNDQVPLAPDPMTSKETTELLRVYYSVSDEKRRKSIVKFIKENFSE